MVAFWPEILILAIAFKLEISSGSLTFDAMTTDRLLLHSMPIPSFPVALLIGVVYVFGMVAPLAVIALVWANTDPEGYFRFAQALDERAFCVFRMLGDNDTQTVEHLAYGLVELGFTGVARQHLGVDVFDGRAM